MCNSPWKIKLYSSCTKDMKRFPVDCIKKNPFNLLVILYPGLGQHKKAKTKYRYCAISKFFILLRSKNQ